jgi:hypothetical protein
MGTNDTPVPPPRRHFLVLAAVLLCLGVAATLVQKSREGEVALTAAQRAADRGEASAGMRATEEDEARIQRLIQESAIWQTLALVAIALALASWEFAWRRREDFRRVRVVLVVMFALYILLQMMMV